MELPKIKLLIENLERQLPGTVNKQHLVDLINELKYAVTISSFDGEPSQFINKDYVIYCRCGEKADKVKSLFTCPKCD